MHGGGGMVVRFFLLLLGFGLAVAGGVAMILYLNLIPIGNDYLDYMTFIIHRPECYLFLIGILLIWISVSWPPRRYNRPN